VDGQRIAEIDAREPSLTRVRKDQMAGGWLVTCAVCGKLAVLRGFWPAARMARDHEPIHAGAPGIGGDDGPGHTGF